MHQFRCRSKPWKRGVAAWDCKSSSLIVSCALFSHPECCPELTSDLEHSLEDSSVWIHQHLYSLPVPIFSSLST